MLPATSPQCTMAHVVSCAVAEPTTRAAFLVALDAASSTHSEAAQSFGRAECPARVVALACMMACEDMITALRVNGALPVYLKPDAQAIAFGAAVRALKLPRADRLAIAARGFAHDVDKRAAIVAARFGWRTTKGDVPGTVERPASECERAANLGQPVVYAHSWADACRLDALDF